MCGFSAMGVDVVVRGADDVELASVRALFAEWDRTFSRFRRDSELRRVNRARARSVSISPLFARVLHVALGAAEATDGLVDPTLGAGIEAAGYDRDSSLLVDDPRPPASALPGAWRSVRLSGLLLSRPPGVRLDLNGVVKSLAVDEALQILSGDGFVAAGGDVAVRGGAVVGLPGGSAVRVLAGGVATSGTTHRRWRRAGALQHHLIDARTGRPSRSRWTQVTVAAASCVTADVAAKAAFFLSDDGPGWLDEHGLPGRFVEGERVVPNRSWLEEAA
jgi:thiamine biosynthesis lipoprotein